MQMTREIPSTPHLASNNYDPEDKITNYKTVGFQNHDMLAFIERLNDIASYWSACEGQNQQDRPISVELFSRWNWQRALMTPSLLDPSSLQELTPLALHIRPSRQH